MSLQGGCDLHHNEQPAAGTAALNGKIKSGKIMRVWVDEGDTDEVLTITAYSESFRFLGTASVKMSTVLSSKGQMEIGCDHGAEGISIQKTNTTLSRTAVGREAPGQFQVHYQGGSPGSNEACSDGTIWS